MRVILFLISLLSATASHAFDVNVSEIEIERFQHGILAGDLIIGDTASVYLYQFCVTKDGKLVYPKGSGLTKSDYGHFIIKIEPKNQISLTRNEKIDTDGKPSQFASIPQTTECTESKIKHGYFEVKTINGFTNMKDYLKFLEDSGYKSNL